MQETNNDKPLIQGNGYNPVEDDSMKLKGPFTYGAFLERPNRFLAICQLNGQHVRAYIPNPGPMPDLLFPGVELILRHAPAPHRSTDYDLVCARHQGIFLSLDCRVPNWILSEALPAQTLPPFADYSEIISEPPFGESRLDFLLEGENLPSCYIEAKSSTDAINEIGYFPRAVTPRGQRHLHELMHAKDNGYRAAVVFIVQRTDARCLRPNDQIDPNFGAALREAVRNGVEAFAWTTRFDEECFEISVNQQIPVDLTPAPDHNSV
jgi:sugar fermentation stimulation protein A